MAARRRPCSRIAGRRLHCRRLDGVIYFGEEVRNPGRDIPRAIFGSVFSVMGIYLLLNLVALYVLPMNEIAGNNFVLGAVADRVFGRPWAILQFARS